MMQPSNANQWDIYRLAHAPIYENRDIQVFDNDGTWKTHTLWFAIVHQKPRLTWILTHAAADGAWKASSSITWNQCVEANTPEISKSIRKRALQIMNRIIKSYTSLPYIVLVEHEAFFSEGDHRRYLAKENTFTGFCRKWKSQVFIIWSCT